MMHRSLQVRALNRTFPRSQLSLSAASRRVSRSFAVSAKPDPNAEPPKVIHSLHKLFNPKSVAVIGATEKAGSVGRTLLWNLLSSPFGGCVYPVNATRKSVLGIHAYKSLKEVPPRQEGNPVDLAVVVVPAQGCVDVIRQCVQEGTKAAIVISAGFAEAGEEGKRWGRQMLEEARKGGLRLIGPNCLGVMNPMIGMNATFAHDICKAGRVAFISQSGALGTAILDWSLKEQVGFSGFVSIGTALDVAWGDLLEYYGSDPNTSAIVLYMESIINPRAFISAARLVALTKPIIVIKVGRTSAGTKAAASHTGTLTGSDAVMDVVFQRCGVLRVKQIDELFGVAEVLAKQPLPWGNRLSIVTNAGGPGVLATDALIDGGGELAVLTKETMKALDDVLPAPWSHGNPIDVLGDAPPERYEQALKIAAKDKSSDGMLVILSPQAMTDPVKTAEVLKPYNHLDKPLLASWMGSIAEGAVAQGRSILTNANIPTFLYPDTAATVFNYTARYRKQLEQLYSTPTLMPIKDQESFRASRLQAIELVEKIRSGGRTILTEHESKTLLELYEIPTTKTVVATSEAEAMAAARQIGFPVVLKLHSKTITHKVDVGGVLLNLKNDAEVEEGFKKIFRNVSKAASEKDFDGVTVQKMVSIPTGSYEVIIGSNIDPQFGPVILFGTGGSLVEVFKDTALELPPLTSSLARQLVERTKISKAMLKTTRGRPPIKIEELERLLVQFSRLVVDVNEIKEIDLNPVIVGNTDVLAVDARVVLHDKGAQIPLPAIRPYPYHYERVMQSKDGEILIRPVRADDQQIALDFMDRVANEGNVQLEKVRSEEALKFVRAHIVWKSQIREQSLYNSLVTLCFGDFDREIVLLAFQKTGKSEEVIGIARVSRVPSIPDSAEMAIIVDNSHQGKGIGGNLVQTLIEITKNEASSGVGPWSGIKSVFALFNKGNISMMRVSQRFGMTVSERDDGRMVATAKF